jgi:hypothetical protein
VKCQYHHPKKLLPAIQHRLAWLLHINYRFQLSQQIPDKPQVYWIQIVLKSKQVKDNVRTFVRDAISQPDSRVTPIEDSLKAYPQGIIRTNIPWQHLEHHLPLWWTETLVLYYVLLRKWISHMVPKPECKYWASRHSWELHKEEEITFTKKTYNVYVP